MYIPLSGQRPARRTIYRYTQPAPAAGADWSVNVPSGKLWQIQSIYARLVTDANVANRGPRLILSDGGAEFLRLPAAVVAAAGVTTDYQWFANAVSVSLNNGVSFPLPPLILAPGAVVSVATASIQVGDQWGAPQLYIIETTLETGVINFDDAAVGAAADAGDLGG